MVWLFIIPINSLQSFKFKGEKKYSSPIMNTIRPINIVKEISNNNTYKDMHKENLFDFWVGKWEAIWDEGNNKIGKGTNEVTKILDGKVIKENFIISEGQSKGFKGVSISVYNEKTDIWKQAWADNQGGYYDFTGEFHADKRIFKTQTINKNGKQFISRMVFKDITKDSFIWDWESSSDNGVTWNLNWRINYKRIY